MPKRGHVFELVLIVLAFSLSHSVMAVAKEAAVKPKVQKNAESWGIEVGKRVGRIRAESTEMTLRQAYGSDNVRSEKIDLGEGDTEPGTVLFPKDPKRRLEIAWCDKQNRAFPRDVTMDGKSTQWSTMEGVHLGTSLKALERVNGGPFELSGFGWDYSGTVTSWMEGQLAVYEVHEGGRLVLRLQPTHSKYSKLSKRDELPLGDQTFSSNHPSMQKLDPVVYQMVVFFTSNIEKMSCW